MAVANESNTERRSSVEDNSFSMKFIVKSLASKWPAVKNLSTTSLYRMLYQDLDLSQGQIHVFDVRPEEEYHISHLKESKRIEPSHNGTKEAFDSIRPSLNDDKPTMVVCYCSLGYRSSKCAQSLTKLIEEECPDKLDKVKIYNLEGSLFKWANEGKPMVDNKNQETIFVHPYSAIWGKVLNKPLRKWKLEDEAQV